MPDEINYFTVEQYLAAERTSTTKHQLIDGQVYAIAGASKNHERISGNIFAELRSHLKGSRCEPFGPGTKIKIDGDFYYPDMLIDCEVNESITHYTETPILVVEVISKSTRKMDEQHKFLRYINIPSLQEYVMVEQDFVDVTVCRKAENWRPMHYFPGDDVHLTSVDLQISVEDIYSRVHNEEMLAFNKQ